MTIGLRWPRAKLARALVIVAASVLIVVGSHRWWLAPLLSRQLSTSSGRPVHFDAVWLGVSAAFEPVVHLRGVRIDNAPWADTRRPFAVLEEAVAVFSWTSVEQRRPVIALMVLRDGEVDLEVEADGLRNWRLGQPDYRGPGRYKILSIQAERSTVRYRNGGLDLDFEARATANQGSAGSPGAADVLPTRIEWKGTWRKLPFAAVTTSADVLTFTETGRMFGVRGSLDAGGARLELDGRAADIIRGATLDARVSFAGDSLAPFDAIFGPRFRVPKAFRVAGRLQLGNGSYGLSAAQARVGATDLAGELSLAPGGKRSVVHARLRSESADLADLRWLAGRGAEQSRTVVAARAAEPAKAFDGTAARSFDADLGFAARRLRAAEFPLVQSLQVDAALVDGQLTVSRLDVGVGQGHANGQARIDLGGELPSGRAELTLRGVRIETLLHGQTDKNRVTGALQGTATLQATGASADALLASVSGTVSAALVGGTISSLVDAQIGLQGGKILRSMMAGSAPIAIRCAAAAFDLQRGVGHLRSFVLDTERTRTTATGSVDLPRARLDVVLTPEAKEGGLFNLERSIHLHGPLQRPERNLIERAKRPAPVRQGCPIERP